MNKSAEYKMWLSSPFLTAEEKKSLENMTEAEVEAFFGGGLGFGTSGVRGIRGLGSRGINRFTLGRYMAAYATILAGRGAKRVLLCRDSRIGGLDFLHMAAACLNKEGIEAWVFGEDGYAPSPLLSFSVRHGGFDGGINLTSSHNTADYSGVKIFGHDGVLLSDSEARDIEGVAHKMPLPFDIPCEFSLMAASPELERAYIRGCADSYRSNGRLKAVFTPLHGVSGELMKKCAEACGFEISIVEAQFAPDGNFSTVLSPNPEDPASMAMAIAQAEREGADMVVALDPDGDRMGAAVRIAEGFVHVNPNRMAALMLDYMLNRKENAVGRRALVTTYVSGMLPQALAGKRGVEVHLTPTGFKNIADRRAELEKQGIRALLSYEEAFGYMVEGATWDKDGITAALTAMSAYEALMESGGSMAGRWCQLMEECGYFDERNYNFMTGSRSPLDIFTKTAEMLLEMSLNDKKTFRILSAEHFCDINTLRIDLECGILWVRPSGTEPKLKLYGHGRGGSLAEAAQSAEEVIALGACVINNFMGED